MTAYSSFGSLVQIADAAGTTYTTIAQVLDISGPEFSVDTEEVTNHSSPGGYEEFVPTIKRSGELSFDIRFDPSHATHLETGSGLVALLNSRALRNMRVKLPTTPARRWAFTGYVTGLGNEMPVAGTINTSVTIRISGSVTLENDV